MKNVGRIIFIMVIAVLLMGSSVQAQSGNSEAESTVEVYATVLSTIALQTEADMYFGAGTSPQSDSTTNTVTLGTDGTTNIDYTGFWDGATAQAAELTVTGQQGRAYGVDIDGTAVTHGTAASLTTPVSLGGGLTVNNFVVVESNNSAFDNDSSGSDTLVIGADLFVPNDAAAGDYTGNFNVTVSYE